MYHRLYQLGQKQKLSHTLSGRCASKARSTSMGVEGVTGYDGESSTPNSSSLLMSSKEVGSVPSDSVKRGQNDKS